MKLEINHRKKMKKKKNNLHGELKQNKTKKNPTKKERKIKTKGQ